MVNSSRVVQLHASKSEGQEFPIGDKIVPRKFYAVAKVLWPVKTAACLAAIARCDERTAKRWLAGESEPPISVACAMFHEIFREQTELNL